MKQFIIEMEFAQTIGLRILSCGALIIHLVRESKTY